MKHVDIFTDGACSGNPGPGGWGAILRYGKTEKELSGGELLTTNNQMEMTAVIEALKLLKEPCDVTLTTDSTMIDIPKLSANSFVKAQTAGFSVLNKSLG